MVKITWTRDSPILPGTKPVGDMVNETRLKVEFLVMVSLWLEERERSCRLIRGQSKPSRRLKNRA